MPPRVNAIKFMHGLLSVLLITIGAQIWSPSPTYQGGTSWVVLARLISEPHLGMVCCGVGTLALLSLFLESLRFKLGSVAALGLVHILMAGSFVLGNPAGIGSILLLGNAVTAFFLLYRHFAED